MENQHEERVSQIASRLLNIRSFVPANVRIVAVTKGRSPEWVVAALECGIVDFGENYSDELLMKNREVTKMLDAFDLPAPRWHYLGKLQSNKIPRLAGIISWWQTLDRSKTASSLARHTPDAKVLLQVRTNDDPERPGVAPEALGPLLDHARSIGVDVQGLMCVAQPKATGPEEDFAMLARLADIHGLPERSMGMSQDYEEAVRYGATMLRLGRIIFDPEISTTKH